LSRQPLTAESCRHMCMTLQSSSSLCRRNALSAQARHQSSACVVEEQYSVAVLFWSRVAPSSLSVATLLTSMPTALHVCSSLLFWHCRGASSVCPSLLAPAEGVEGIQCTSFRTQRSALSVHGMIAKAGHKRVAVGVGLQLHGRRPAPAGLVLTSSASARSFCCPIGMHAPDECMCPWQQFRQVCRGCNREATDCQDHISSLWAGRLSTPCKWEAK
jgi:hypothetical protein